MSTATARYYSLEEYFDREEKSPLRHEYYDGKIFTMPGSSNVHSLITTSVAAVLYNAIASQKDYRGYPCLMRIACPPGLYTYPDAALVHGPSDLLRRPDNDTLKNPILIAEVLSPSTENYDRGDKFEHYKTIPTLRGYLLIAQDKPRVEYLARKAGEPWQRTNSEGLDVQVDLPKLKITLALADIYEQVGIPSPVEQTPPTEHPPAPKQ